MLLFSFPPPYTPPQLPPTPASAVLLPEAAQEDKGFPSAGQKIPQVVVVAELQWIVCLFGSLLEQPK